MMAITISMGHEGMIDEEINSIGPPGREILELEVKRLLLHNFAFRAEKQSIFGGPVTMSQS